MSQKANNLIDRLKKELKINKDKDLCKILEIKHNTLSTWKKRDTVDFNKILLLCEENNLDLNYIFFEEDLRTKEGIVLHNSEKDIKYSKPESKLQSLLYTKLVNTNRNISIFINEFSNKNEGKFNEIILGQKISNRKIAEDTLYILKCKNNELYLDKLYKVINLKGDVNSYSLKDNKVTLSINEIKSVWQVLDKNILPS